MRILYITPFVPWPLRVRSFNLIPRLAERHQIHLVCLSGSAEEDARVGLLSGFCHAVCCVRHTKAKALLQSAAALATPRPLRMAYFASRAMQKTVRTAVAKFSPDVIYLERWRALTYVPPNVGVPVICDPTDSMLLYNQRLIRTGRWWERLVALEETVKFRRYEARLARQADAVVFCSQIDLDCTHQYAPGVRYVLVPNGVDCQQYFQKQPQEEEPNTLVCTGNLSYGPNRHAVRFLLDEILPLVRRQIRSVKLVVAGKGSRAYLGRETRNTSGLEVVDFVPELRPYIARATVAVAPITVGAGVCNKVVEAFSTGTPVVATRLACGDMPVKDGVHLFLADQAVPFAERVVRLLRDPVLRASLVSQARRLVEEKYDWNIVYLSMERAMLDLVHGQSASDRPFLAVGAQAR
jgi:glycosyltransferase involved in cell wall biosynthesis